MFVEAVGERALAVLEQSSLINCEVFVADFLLDPGQLSDNRLLFFGVKNLLVLLSIVLLLGSGFIASLSPFRNLLCATLLVVGLRLSLHSDI